MLNHRRSCLARSAASAASRTRAKRSKQYAPAAATPPAANATDVMLVRSSKGTTTRQPSAAPSRSAAYRRLGEPPDLVKASVTATPASRNGSPSTSVANTIALTSRTLNSSSTGMGIDKLPMCINGIARANQTVTRGSSRIARCSEYRSPPTNTSTAPAAMPSIANDTVKNAR
jgi:hypothetical protein